MLSMGAGTASRYCDEYGSWGEPNVLECESTEFRGIRLEVSVFKL